MKRDNIYEDFEYFVPTLTDTPDNCRPEGPQWPVKAVEPEPWKDLLLFLLSDLMRYRWCMLIVAGLMILSYVPAAAGYVAHARLLRLFFGVAFAAFVIFNELRSPDETDLPQSLREFHPHHTCGDAPDDIVDQVDPYLPQHLKRDRLWLTLVAGVVGLLFIVLFTGMFAPYYVLLIAVTFFVRWLLDRLI